MAEALYDLGDATDEEILALRDLLVYGHAGKSGPRAEAASRIYAKIVRLARKVESERRADERSRV